MPKEYLPIDSLRISSKSSKIILARSSLKRLIITRKSLLIRNHS